MKKNYFILLAFVLIFYSTSWAQLTSYGGIIEPGTTAGNFGGNTSSFFGAQAGAMSSGFGNTFIGFESGYNNIGSANTFVGRSSGHHNEIGVSNTFIGRFSGYNNISGSANTFLGRDSGYNNTIGSWNTFIGRESGYTNINGLRNTFLGRASGYNNLFGSGNVFLGNRAGYNETGSELLYIDNSDTSSPLIWGDFSANALRFNGSVRITSIPQNNGLTHVLVEDADGDIHWRDAATLDTNTERTDEEIRDVAGAMVSGNTETRIAVTYDDAANEFDFVVEGNLSQYNNDVGFITNPNDADANPNNEIQDLSLSANTLSLSGDNTTVDLAPYMDNTDDQNLDLVGSTLSITGGNNVDLSSLSDGTGTDDQQLNLVGNNLQLEDGGNVDLSTYMDNTDEQTLTFNEATRRLFISDGNSVNLGSLGGDNLGDHFVMHDLLPVFSGFPNLGTIGASFNNIHFNGALYVNDQEFLHTQNNNIALGVNALSSITTGTQNVALGESALENNRLGNNNTAIGYDADISDIAFGTVSNSTAIGNEATVTASNQVRIGNATVTSIGGYVGWTTLPSDSRFKVNVEENITGLDFINKLRPVSYNIDLGKIRKSLNPNDISDDSPSMSDKQIGFIAQEVVQTISDNGYVFSGVDEPKNENGQYGIRYAEFVVPLVKGMQELSIENKEQKQRIETLEQRLAQLENMVYGSDGTSTSTEGVKGGNALTKGFSLEQNIPNPFNETTTITVELPKTVSEAKIVIYSLNGVELQSYPISKRGRTTIEIKGGSLQSGMYLYALLADGQLIDTKKMILTK